uniref:Uncharacterized protein n=1 Tax=Cannabis sativa TaxID=3483 RepID=A0A803RA16_CANSA
MCVFCVMSIFDFGFFLFCFCFFSLPSLLYCYAFNLLYYIVYYIVGVDAQLLFLFLAFYKIVLKILQCILINIVTREI